MQSVTWMHFGQGPVQQKQRKHLGPGLLKSCSASRPRKRPQTWRNSVPCASAWNLIWRPGRDHDGRGKLWCQDVVTFSIIFTRFSYPIVALGLDSPCEPVSCHCQGTAVEEHERRMEEAGDTSRPVISVMWICTSQVLAEMAARDLDIRRLTETIQVSQEKKSQGRWEVEGCRAADVRQMQRLLKSCLLRLASLDGPWSIDLLRDHLMMLCEHHVNFRAKKKLLKTMDEKDFISQGKEPVLKPH